MNFKTKELERVLSVYDSGFNLKVAADKCDVSPQCICKNVINIEYLLGFQIFQRGHRKYVDLTEKGVEAIEIIREIVSHSKLLEVIKTH